MATKIKTTIVTRTLLFTKIVAAIAQYLTAAVVLHGKSLTPQALSALFTAVLQAQKDLEDARANVTAKQQARDAALADVTAILPDFRKYLAVLFGEDSTAYAAFGLPTPKAAVRTAQNKADAVAKAKATRKAHEEPVTPAPAPAVPPPKS
ncbi:MAG TPA: hypothetical protein VIY73_25325 [Polyangiaceae bacterium]